MFSQINHFFSLSFATRRLDATSLFLFGFALRVNNDALKDKRQNLSFTLSCSKNDFLMPALCTPHRPPAPLTPPPTFLL